MGVSEKEAQEELELYIHVYTRDTEANTTF